MVEMEVVAGTAVIRQGAPGDHFYVVTAGQFDAYISSVGEGMLSVKVHLLALQPSRPAATPASVPSTLRTTNSVTGTTTKASLS